MPIPIRRPGPLCRVLVILLAGSVFPAAAAHAQTAQPAPAVPTPAAPTPAAPAQPAAQQPPTREALQQQLDAQMARNDQLRQRIAKLEEIMKTDVCNNPEAAALLKAEQQQTSPR